MRGSTAGLLIDCPAETGDIMEGTTMVLLLPPSLQGAPVWDSEDYAEYLRYQYRVCDYAYALLTAKGNEPVNLREKTEERDRLIQAFSK